MKVFMIGGTGLLGSEAAKDSSAIKYAQENGIEYIIEE